MHSIVEMLKIKNKEHHENIQTGQKKYVQSDFSSETMEDRIQWNNITEVLKNKIIIINDDVIL